MLRIALCGPIAFAGDDLVASLAALVRDLDGADPRIETYAGAADLVDACTETADDDQPVDLVVACQTLPGITGLQMASELRDLGFFSDGMRFVLCAPDATRAADAARHDVSAYLVEPVSTDELSRALAPLVRDLHELHGASTVLKCREGTRRVAFGQISYVETSGRDQAIHRHDASELSTRCSSRALFAHLADDGRFYKLGSSYIINLDYVAEVSMRTGMVTLLDATQIPAPVRLRTELADAVCAHARATI